MEWWEQLLLIALWGTAGTLATWFVILLFEGRKVASRVIVTFILGCLLRAWLIIVNDEFQVFDENLAGTLSLQHFHFYFQRGHGLLELMGEEFAAQVFLNIPGWVLFGPERLSLIMSNAAMGAIAAPLAAGLLYRALGQEAARRALVLISLYPDGLNFSIFGLRCVGMRARALI
jgi:hypothetical protein